MKARRITYLALLAVAALLHFAYGQYVTNYMLLFLLLTPVLSVLLSLPAALTARAELVGGGDVCRGRPSRVRLTVMCRGFIPPEAWHIKLKAHNLFTGGDINPQKVSLGSEWDTEREFTVDTFDIGCVRWQIAHAWIFDYLGIIPIPVKKGGAVSVTVFPDKVKPAAEPDLVGRSARALRPKPQGFSEEHELRTYKEGDPLNLIHWKLSSKYDDYIVREPQEVVRRDIALVISPPAQYRAHRSVLEQLCWLDDVLRSSDISYMLYYGVTVVRIRSENDFEDFMREVLSAPMRVENARTPDTGNDVLIYRIMPESGVRR